MQLNSGPLITFYAANSHSAQAAAVPNRVELSQATVDNWIAKTSNLLSDEFGFGPDLAGEASASIDLPLHWLHSVWLASLWNLGAYVTTNEPTASIIVTEADQVEAALQRAGRHQAVVGCTLGDGLDPLGQGSNEAERTVPPTAIDYSHDVRMFADSFDSGFTSSLDDIAFETASESFTHAQLSQLAAEFLAAHGAKTGARILLSELPLQPTEIWPAAFIQNPQLATSVILGTLIAAPTNQGPSRATSLVLCRGLNPEQIAHIAEQERAIRVA
ncbi:MAG: TIGR03089 family protein [Candidatus Nanopelagicales bacterium]